MAGRAAERLRTIYGHVPSDRAERSDDGEEAALVRLGTVSAPGNAPGPEAFPQCATIKEFPEAKHDVLFFDQMLSNEEKLLRDRVRRFMELEVAPIIAGYWERAEFPFQLIPKLRHLGIAGLSVKQPDSAGLSLLGAAVVMTEVSRVDASLSTFLLVHGSLAILTLQLLGSEQQKRELLPKMANFDLIGCWGLTEPNNGSDASALTTSATKVSGGWVLNGRKRWIGNATFADVAVIWAKNMETGQVNAFIVRKGTRGFHTKKIETKMAMRVVQNADIYLENVFVPDSAKLPGANSFKDTSKVLAISRIMVAWQPVGVARGIYDMCLRYVNQRHQFRTPLAAFQLTQEKLSRMLGNIQAMTLMGLRLTQLQEAGKMTHGTASLIKAWNTLRGRETAALGREILGGNGLLADFHVAKAFCDLEAIYTYEGTYDINSLVAGREITGIAAIKAINK